MRTKKPQNPLEPMATVAGVAFTLVVLTTALGIASTVFGSGSMFGWGTGFVCGNAANVSTGVDFSATKPGVSASAQGVQVCTDNPDLGQRFLAMLTELPTFLLFAGAIFLIRRLIREAESRGPLTPRMASRLRGLGWFLVAASLGAMVAEGTAQSYLLATLLDKETYTPLGVVYWEWPLVTLFAALGVLTFARILRLGAGTREPA